MLQPPAASLNCRGHKSFPNLSLPCSKVAQTLLFNMALAHSNYKKNDEIPSSPPGKSMVAPGAPE